MSRESPKKCWCFTLHPEEEGQSLHEWMEYQWSSGMFKYMVGQAERGTETGRVHLQGFVVLETKKRLSSMKQLDKRAHWEPMQGTVAQAVAYCKKTDTRVDGPWEYGEIKGAGRPSTLELVGDMVKAGKTDQEIAEEVPTVFMRQYKGIRELRVALKIRIKVRDWAPEIWVLYGPSGTGKSAFAKANWPDAYWKPKDRGDTFWWDGYSGEETVVIDDMQGCRMKLNDAQNLMDRYPLKVPFKGGYTEMLAKRYVFTSNFHPGEWYTKDEAKTIWRRVCDYGVGHVVYCGRGPWIDEFTRQPWEPEQPYLIPDFVRDRWHSTHGGSMVPDFPGNTSGNPAPEDAWANLADRGW